MYISQDPIGLADGNPTLYGYVFDSNSWVDVLGLSCKKIVIGEGMDRVKSAAKREIGCSEFLYEYNTPENYRPETLHTNKSYKLEDKTETFKKQHLIYHIKNLQNK